MEFCISATEKLLWCMTSGRNNKHLNNSFMTQEEFFKSKGFKILLPVILAALVIVLWRNGFEFGQWLHRILNQ
jgi:hypothetical protein